MNEKWPTMKLASSATRRNISALYISVYVLPSLIQCDMNICSGLRQGGGLTRRPQLARLEKLHFAVRKNLTATAMT